MVTGRERTVLRHTTSPPLGQSNLFPLVNNRVVVEGMFCVHRREKIFTDPNRNSRRDAFKSLAHPLICVTRCSSGVLLLWLARQELAEKKGCIYYHGD